MPCHSQNYPIIHSSREGKYWVRMGDRLPGNDPPCLTARGKTFRSGVSIRGVVPSTPIDRRWLHTGKNKYSTTHFIQAFRLLEESMYYTYPEVKQRERRPSPYGEGYRSPSR